MTIKVVSSNSTNCDVYSIQLYVLKFVSDLWQIGGFLLVLRCPPPIKLTAIHHDITDILFKETLKLITLTRTTKKIVGPQDKKKFGPLLQFFK